MRTKKFLILIIFAVWFSFFDFSFAQNIDRDALIQQLQKQVEELTKQIQTLKQQLGVVQSELGAPASAPVTEPIATESEPTPTEPIPEFTKTLSRGSSGDEVRKLQEFLKKDKEIYPDRLITGYFGPKTEEALKRWQKKHNIEQVGILGPQTRARFQELGRGVIQGLLQQGAGASGVIPPGLQTAPGIQKKLEVGTTTQATTTPPSIATTTLKIPPRPDSCAASNNYCINSDECSKNGYYWCRNSCYATSTACLGEVYTPPVQSAVSTTKTAIQTIQTSQPTSQTTTSSQTTTQISTATTTETTQTVFANTSGWAYGDAGVTLIPSTNSVDISWKASGATGALEYWIYRDSLLVKKVPVSLLSTTDTGLSHSTKYTYSLKAVDSAGHIQSSSNSVSVTTLASSMSIPQVQGFTASVSGASVNLSWQVVSGVNISNILYNVHRQRYWYGSGTSWDYVADSSNRIAQGNFLSYTDSNPPLLRYSTMQYRYKIIAQDEYGNVGPASLKVDVYVPTQVYGLSASVTSSSSDGNSVNLLWQAVPYDGYTRDDFSYNIYRAGNSDFTLNSANMVAQVKGSNVSYVLVRHPPGTYYFKVATQNVDGVVGLSSSAVQVTLSDATITSTTTSSTNQDTTSRLAQILESLKSLVNALQSIIR